MKREATIPFDVPDAPADPNVFGLRGLDQRWVDVPPRADVNAGFVPEAPRDGGTYGRNGRDGRWQPVEGGAVWIGDAPPANATPGTLWWRNDPDGNLFILVQNPGGGGLHWVPASSTSGGGGGIGEAPADGAVYGRLNNGWAPILRPDVFLSSLVWTVDAGDTVGAEYTFVFPARDLPPRAVRWAAMGAGEGGFFTSNAGLPNIPIFNINYQVQVEDGFDSGVFVPTATVSFNNTTLTNPNSIVRTPSAAPGGNRLFAYDPATEAGLRVRLVCTVATATSIATQVNLGLQGQIMQLI
jgi:hypothetical protein